MAIPWKQQEEGLPAPITSEPKKNGVAQTLNLLEGLGSQSSSTSLRASLTRRRTVVRLIFGTLVAWGSIYWALTCWGYFTIDVLKNGAGPISSQALTELELTTEVTDEVSNTILPLETPETHRIIEGSKDGYTGPDPEHLVFGLPLATKNPVDVIPSSGLGVEADLAYKWGPTTLTEYKQDLDSFIVHHFPRALHEALRRDLDQYLGGTSLPGLNDLPGLGANGASRQIYMTDKNDRKLGEYRMSTWRENKDGWGFNFMDDLGAQRFVNEELRETRMKDVWDALPNGILRADMLRYTLLYLKGGIYTDTDTSLLKHIADWGEDPDLYRQGRGWLFPEDREGEPTEEEKTKLKRRLKRASVVVGIESDVDDREDWHDWWPRPLQIVQWTLGSAPHHPIFLDTLLSITRSTAAAYKWQHDQHVTHLTQAAAAAAIAAVDDQTKSSPPTLTSEPSEGGPVGIMEWTGPGVWTDSVLRYLRIKYGVRWTDLRRLAKPLRVGEVVILPITGFSPGVGNFGAMSAKHPQAMVEHHFAGSWKHKTNRKD